MRVVQTEFYSEGCKLDGALYLPDDYKPGERRPAIIPNSGYQGFNEFYPKLFSEYLTKAGFVCLGFDYRGFAKSEGVRGRVILDEQVQDIRNAITYLRTRDEVDPERIGLIGWGMGASNVGRAAAADPRVRAVAALNGFYVGERWLKSVHTYVNWHRILQQIEEDRVRRVTTGQSLLADPFLHYPLDETTEQHVNVELAHIPAFGKQTALQFTESIVEMNAEAEAAKIAPRPLFIAHGKSNLLHPREEAEALYAAAREPKTLYWIDGKHNDFMYRDHPEMNRLMDRVIEFFNVL